MQQFLFNGVSVFDQADKGAWASVEATATFGKQEPVRHNPVTFPSASSFLVLPTLHAYSTMSISFHFKTVDSDGLLLYNNGRDNDFVAIELVDGRMHYVFDFGDGARVMQSPAGRNLADNKWHEVTVTRPTSHRHILTVDDETRLMDTAGDRIHLDLTGNLYLGSVRPDLFASLSSQVRSRRGFRGCLASVDLNEKIRDIYEQAAQREGDVRHGCDGPKQRCSPASCFNAGWCVQKWDTFYCDCNMTSYRGERCEKVSIAYEFGARGGVIVFRHRDGQFVDTREDHIAFAMQTARPDAALLKVTSANSNDFLEVKMEEGHIRVVYNLGSETHQLASAQRVDDSTYHVVKFRRIKENASLQIDYLEPIVRVPAGKQMHVFNGQEEVHVGGLRTDHGHVISPYMGSMSGLFFNGIRILDLLAGSDDRVKVYGDIRLAMVMSPPEPTAVTQAEMHRTQERKTSSVPRGLEGFQSTSDGTEGELIPTTTDIIVTTLRNCEMTDNGRCATKAMAETTRDLIQPTVTYKTTTSTTTTTSRPTTIRSTSTSTTAKSTKKQPPSSSVDCDEKDPNCKQSTVARSPTTTVISSATTTTRQMSMTEVPTFSSASPPELTTASLSSDAVAASLNTGMIIGIVAAAVVAILLLIYALYKYRNRDEGSYKIDESKNFGPFADSLEDAGGPSAAKQTNGASAGLLKCDKGKNAKNKRKDIKEWYV